MSIDEDIGFPAGTRDERELLLRWLLGSVSHSAIGQRADLGGPALAEVLVDDYS